MPVGQMNNQRKAKVATFLSRTKDENDGVFWAIAEEEGIDVYDIADYEEEIATEQKKAANTIYPVQIADATPSKAD